MKVAYFDYWTKGLGNFTCYDKQLKALGCTTKLLHLGSLREPHPPEQIVDGVLCRDLSFYKTRLLHKILESERPDIIVTLNAKSLVDRALTLSCRQLGIKMIFITHGINASVDESDMGVGMMEKSFNYFRLKLNRSGKYIRFVVPNYLYSLARNGAGLRDYARSLAVIYSYFKNPGKAIVVPSFVDELVPDKILSFSRRASEHFVRIGYPAERIRIVGNPKYDSLFRRIETGDFRIEQLPAEVQSLLKAKKEYALVLDDSFPEMFKLGGWTDEYRNEHFNQIAHRLEREGYLAVFKLHPVTIAENVKVTAANALVYQTTDLDGLIHFSRFCVAHCSTAVENSVLLEKPVLQPLWDLSANLPNFFGRRGVTKLWHNLEDPIDLNVDRAAREAYKRDCITVLRPSAVQSVVDEIAAPSEISQIRQAR